MKPSVGHRVERLVDVDVDRFRVRLVFEDGVAGWVRLEHLFGQPKGLAAEVLRGGIFERCFVESGALAWPNGLELCPDALRQWLEVTSKHRVA